MVDAMTPPSSVLETARFGLRPLAETDRCDLFAHLADPATVERMDIEPLSDLAGADAIIAWAVRLLAAGQGVRWAIRDHAGGFVGTVGFNALIRERASRGELAYDVVRARWRQGVMAEVMPATLSYGYDELGLRRIEALVTPGNRASAALLERFASTARRRSAITPSGRAVSGTSGSTRGKLADDSALLSSQK